ncbi:MAG: helix-turn-helix domain-containing protein [Caulobacteraceae bacterium]|nr:helix-turn-helix domain-containing protein [Caulobacter sp.]
MPICVRLDRLLVRRRMSLAELADRVGVPAADLALLRSGGARAIRMTTLEALCRELNCEAGEVLEYDPVGATEAEAAQGEG